jgi:hypothetical protein
LDKEKGMKFQERLRALMPEDKQKEADEIFSQMDATFSKYDEDIKTLKATVRARDGVDMKEFERLEAENATFAQQLAELRTANKKAEESSKGLTEKLTGVTAQLHTTMKEKELRAAMSEFKFDPETQNEAFALLASQLNLGVIEDGTGARVTAKVSKDGKDSELAVKDALKAWVDTSPLAKRLIVVGKTSGAGSQGGMTGGAQGKKWADMDIKERTELFVSDPAKAQQLMKE